VYYKTWCSQVSHLNMSTLIWKLLVWIFYENSVFACIGFMSYASLCIIKSGLVVCIRFYEPSICRVSTKRSVLAIQHLEKEYLNKKKLTHLLLLTIDKGKQLCF
jgi:hypothetical protein